MTTSTDTRSLVLATIREAERNRPRSRQVRIGPSQVGIECLHHLALAWLGVRDDQDTATWYPFIGTAVHAELARIFGAHPDRFLVEQDVCVGWCDDREVWGSADLYVKATATVLDFKVVGSETLRAAKQGPSGQYRAQVHLYGRGILAAGWPVEHVAIAYLPRNAASLDAAVWWTEPWDEQLATDPLDRLEHLAVSLSTLDAISPNARDVYVAGLPRDPAHCFACKRDTRTVPTLDALAGVSAA